MFIRPRFIPTIAPLVLLLAASCAKDEERPKPASTVTEPAFKPPTVEAEAEAKVNVAPTLGGSVFLVGQQQVELAVASDGRVEGLVFDAQGNGVAPDRVASFVATLSAEGGAKHRVDLRWDAAAKRFSGKAALAGALVVQPIDVAVQIDGKAQRGTLESYAFLPAAADAKLEAQADATLTAPKPSAQAKLQANAKAPQLKAPAGSATARAKADVKAVLPKPKVDVSAKASAGSEKKKSGAGASLKAKASIGFGN